MTLSTKTVGEIVRDLPGAAAVLRQAGIDYCCKGGLSLAEAARGRGLDSETLSETLLLLAGRATPPPTLSTFELIETIIERYHRGHAADFSRAIVLADRVEATHRSRDDCPIGLGEQLRHMADELEVHHQKEEAVLFPMMLSGREPARIAEIIRRLDAEHHEFGADLARLSELTAEFTAPDDACATWRALYEVCARIDRELRRHLHVENHVLFPRFA